MRGSCRSWAAGLPSPPDFGLAAAGPILGGQSHQSHQSRLLPGCGSEEAGEGQLQLWQMLAGERWGWRVLRLQGTLAWLMGDVQAQECP